MKKGRIILFVAFIILIFSSLTLAEDYFMFDLENNKILFMGNNDTAFTEKLEVNKMPNFIMKTPNPNKYLAIFAPTINYDKKLFKKVVNLEKSVAGQLFITNIASGRTEDIVDIGHYPFHWEYSKDHKHFFITYQTAPQSGLYELLHYNLETGKTEAFNNIQGEISDLAISSDEKRLFVLVDHGADSRLLTLGVSPLALEKSTPIEKHPQRLFLLSDDRLALLHFDDYKSSGMEAGVVKIINLKDYSTVMQHAIQPSPTYYEWYEKEKVLIVATGQAELGFFGLRGKGNYFKVSAQKISFNESKKPWVDCYYSPENDSLYVLYPNFMEVISYRTNATKEVDSKANVYSNSNVIYFYQITSLPKPGYMAIYCPANGNVKFFDTNKNEIVTAVSCGRSGRKFFASLFNRNAKAAVAASPDQKKYYVLNQATSDLTILDEQFKKLSILVPKEHPIGMFQVKEPKVNIILVTEKKVYQVNCEDDTLQAIHEFKEENKNAYIVEDNNRLLLITNKELLVIDSSTLEVKNSFLLYGNPEDKYTRVKPGEQRYHFIRTL